MEKMVEMNVIIDQMIKPERIFDGCRRQNNHVQTCITYVFPIKRRYCSENQNFNGRLLSFAESYSLNNDGNLRTAVKLTQLPNELAITFITVNCGMTLYCGDVQ